MQRLFPFFQILSVRLFSETSPSARTPKGFSALNTEISQSSAQVQLVDGLDRMYFNHRFNSF